MSRILITGTTSGLGLETAKKLAAKGHHIIMACRNLEKGKAIQSELKKTNSTIDLMYLDMASFESILEFSKKFYEHYAYLDVLINNAGVFCDTHQVTKEGFEMTMGVNYIGQYLLTKKLLGALKETDYGRIINVSSKAGFYGKINIKEDVFKNHPHGFKAYAASKMAQLMFTIYYAEQLKDFNISINAVHPGSVATNIWKGDSFLMKMMAPINKKRYDDPKDACETIVYLATDKIGIENSGVLFEKKDHIMTYPKKVTNEGVIQELMDHTEALIKHYL